LKNPRTNIEKLKTETRRILQNDTLKLKKAVIREIDYLWRNSDQSKGLNIFADEVLKKLRIPKAHKNTLIRDLNKTQEKIANVWSEYFSDVAKTDKVITFSSQDYEKIIAAHSVNFDNIEKDVNQLITGKVRQSAKAGHNFETLRTHLITKGIGAGEAYTLSNTALSQFDNAIMFEYAGQAGIERFKYDGVLHPGSRPFCRDHINKIYTIEEIQKLDNGQGLDVLTSCGGYNCTHYFTALVYGID